MKKILQNEKYKSHYCASILLFCSTCAKWIGIVALTWVYFARTGVGWVAFKDCFERIVVFEDYLVKVVAFEIYLDKVVVFEIYVDRVVAFEIYFDNVVVLTDWTGTTVFAKIVALAAWVDWATFTACASTY